MTPSPPSSTSPGGNPAAPDPGGHTERGKGIWDPFLDLPLDPEEWPGYYRKCRETGLEPLAQEHGARSGLIIPSAAHSVDTGLRAPYDREE